ncbi:hypothetical protein A5621_06070 [Mycobacterium colombiense]|nr:hypothetical protein A5621_06070 [Mycobacterium colombiense]
MVTSKLRAQRPSFRTEEPDSTFRLPLQPALRTTGATAYQLGLTVDGRETLSGISFTARPGAMTAVIGPSAARNSALLALLAGTRELSAGRVIVDGHDIQAEPEFMRWVALCVGTRGSGSFGRPRGGPPGGIRGACGGYPGGRGGGGAAEGAV